jgi:hypothetical protein
MEGDLRKRFFGRRRWRVNSFSTRPSLSAAIWGHCRSRNGSTTEYTERVKRTLRVLLLTGLRQFDAGVDRLVSDTECACATYPVKETKPYRRYDFGPTECSKTGGICGIADFLRARRVDAGKILERLQELSDQRKSLELQRIQQFLERVLADPPAAPDLNPCLTVGDLLIALESVGVGTFYTMNSKESQHLCRALNQDLVVRSNDAEKDDRMHLNSDVSWPQY